MEAQMLLVIPAYTQGTSWEIEWSITNKFLHKTCFIMPPPGADDETWWTNTWRELKSCAAYRLAWEKLLADGDGHAVVLAPSYKFRDGAAVGASRVRVADVGREEFKGLSGGGWWG